jgi:hypothetical protein
MSLAFPLNVVHKSGLFFAFWATGKGHTSNSYQALQPPLFGNYITPLCTNPTREASADRLHNLPLCMDTQQDIRVPMHNFLREPPQRLIHQAPHAPDSMPPRTLSVHAHDCERFGCLDQKHRRHACSGHSFVSYIHLFNRANKAVTDFIAAALRAPRPSFNTSRSDSVLRCS